MQLTKSRVAIIAAALLLGVSAPVFAQETPAPKSTEEKPETTAKPSPAEQAIQKPDAAKTEKDTAKTGENKGEEENKGDATAATQPAADTKGMVRVNVAAVRDSLATQLQVSAPTIPDIVLAKPDVAGEVCSVPTNSLLATIEAGTDAACTALTTSQALRVAVQKQMTTG
jgi:hypothetical protein